jgi:hypothetical protein
LRKPFHPSDLIAIARVALGRTQTGATK